MEIKLWCKDHEHLGETGDEERDALYRFMLQERCFEIAGEEMSKRLDARVDMPQEGPELAAYFGTIIEEASDSGAICCYLGNEEIARLEKEEWQKYLNFGVKSERLGGE